MSKEFTMERYTELCKAIASSKYRTATVAEHLKKPKSRTIILRHDVERRLADTIAMAKIEKRFGIAATYYIRVQEDTFIPRVMKGLERMGHEIGYH